MKERHNTLTEAIEAGALKQGKPWHGRSGRPQRAAGCAAASAPVWLVGCLAIWPEITIISLAVIAAIGITLASVFGSAWLLGSH